jgi:hypothetical protein
MAFLATMAAFALAAAAPAPSTRLEDHPVAAVRLVALGQKDGTRTAYLAHPEGTVWEVRPGQRLKDGAVKSLEADQVAFTNGTVQRLFASGEPASVTWGADYQGGPLSIEFDGDVSTLAVLISDYTSLPVVLEDATAGPARVSARDAPWDGAFVRALESGGFGYKVEGNTARIGRKERMASLQPVRAGPWTGDLVTLVLRRALFEDLGLVFRQMSGMAVEFPKGPFERITIVSYDRPWDETLEVVAASRKMTWRIDGGRIVLTRVP